MKKSVLFGILIIFLILNVSFIIAVENETKVDNAYSCLEEKVEGRCSSLSLEERIFSLLAIGECGDEITSDSQYKSNIKLRAQAILALDKINVDTIEEEEWLLSQNTTPDDMEWLLQIEGEAPTCTINYGGSSYPNIIIGEDKKINTPAGACLQLYGGDYWLKILPTCYDYEFEISCDKSFSTNLLYKKTSGAGSDTIYVSENTHTASAAGTTTEKVNSFCFSGDTSCDYEASLWSAFVLNFEGYDISPFLPYLITMADENQEYLPESFLYSLTNDFRNELLLKQQSDKWWLYSGDKYYDTALALLPFQNEELEQKTNTRNWLLEEGVQGNDGCWDGGNIRNTAFILYSIWPRGLSFIDDEGIDCGDAGGYCMSPMSCQDSGGENLGEEYSKTCFGASICCDKEKILDTCSEQGGEICGSGEMCSTSTVEASDSSECCIGSCQAPSEKTECELYGDGNCRTSCYSDEEESEEYECDSGEVCCTEKTISEKKSYWWIWVLLILITLVVMGIIFKDKLRPVWFKVKSKLGKFKLGGSKPGPKPRFPPSPPGMLPQRVMPRRVLPPAQRQPMKKPAGKPRKDMDDVLKKLKEMGK